MKLRHAVKKGCTRLVKLLIENGANVHAYNNDDESPLYLALIEKKYDVVDILLEHVFTIDNAIKYKYNRKLVTNITDIILNKSVINYGLLESILQIAVKNGYYNSVLALIPKAKEMTLEQPNSSLRMFPMSSNQPDVNSPNTDEIQNVTQKIC